MLLANALGYVFTIVMNWLSISIPLGGITIQELADRYDNPFTPTPGTFSIWSVIFTLLLVFSLWPLIQSWGKSKISPVQKNIGWLYLVTCIANGAWVAAWQYQYISLSVIIMLVLLVTLIRIHIAVRAAKPTRFDSIITIPTFSIYLGWISVATIANITAWTVSIGWGGWGISQIAWTNIMVIVATLLGTTLYVKYRDAWFNAVIIWALFGIMYKRMNIDAVTFTSIIMTTQICIAFLVGLISSQYLVKRK